MSKDRPKEYKGFGYHSIIEYHNGFAVYHTPLLDSMNNKNLLYHKEIKKLRFKHKKDRKYQVVEGIDEFFVLNIEIVMDVPKKVLSKRFTSKKYSNYRNEFWKDVKHPLYKPLPKGINYALETALTELENIRERE